MGRGTDAGAKKERATTARPSERLKKCNQARAASVDRRRSCLPAEPLQRPIVPLPLRNPPVRWFVKLEQGVVDRARFDAQLRPHLDWVADLQRRGHQPSSGYWADRKGMNGAGAGGMLLFRARDWADAEAIVQEDPLIRSGCVRWELHEWRVVGGELCGAPRAEAAAPSP